MGKREELHKMIEHLREKELMEVWGFIEFSLTRNSGYAFE